MPHADLYILPHTDLSLISVIASLAEPKDKSLILGATRHWKEQG